MLHLVVVHLVELFAVAPVAVSSSSLSSSLPSLGKRVAYALHVGEHSASRGSRGNLDRRDQPKQAQRYAFTQHSIACPCMGERLEHFSIASATTAS